MLLLKNITNVSLELGGKAPAIVFADADLHLAAKAIIASRVINSGQVCNCAERVYVHESVKEEFEQILFAELDKVKFGDPNKERGLDYNIINEFGIGFVPWSDDFKMRSRIVIPSYDQYNNLNYYFTRRFYAL